MPSWTLVFLAITVIAAIFGFGGIAGGTAGVVAGVAQILFFIFLILFVVSLVLTAKRQSF